MTNPSLLERAADACLPALEWVDRRLQERSTLIGIAGWLGTAGFAGFGAQITSHADLIITVAGALSTALVTTSTKPRPPELMLVPTVKAIEQAPAPPAPNPEPNPLALPAPADASPALPSAVSMENDMSSIIVQIEDDVLAFLKAAGKVVVSFALTETQKLVAEVKATYVGTVAMNVIQALESQSMDTEEKFTAVVSAIVPLIEKLIASGGVSGAIASVEGFAREVAQSAYNDLKADLVKIAGGATTQAAA